MHVLCRELWGWFEGIEKLVSRGGVVRITSIKITDQIPNELKTDEDKRGTLHHVVLTFFFPY